MGGDTFALAVLLAFIMMQAQVTTFAEAATLIPTTGSVYDYISCGMGRFFAITGALCAYLIVHIFAGTAETILAGIMALVNFESINAQMAAHQNTWMVGVGMVVMFGLLNAIGVEIFRQGRSGADLRHVDHADHFRPVRHFYGAGDPSFRLVRHAAEHQRYQRSVRLYRHGDVYVRRLRTGDADGAGDQTGPPHHSAGDGAGPLGVASCMFIYGAAINRQVENTVLDAANNVHLLDTPMAIPAFAERVMGHAGQYWLGVGLLLAGCATINTLMAAVPRIIYGMALDGALPRFLTWLHPALRRRLSPLPLAWRSLPARLVSERQYRSYRAADPRRRLRLGRRLSAGDPVGGTAVFVVRTCRAPTARRGSRCRRLSPASGLLSPSSISPRRGWTAAKCWCHSASCSA
jgi:hypothetical protein